MVVGDAHAYLLAHAHEFDIVWASPPCPTHSGQYEAVYPDMKLYEEIIFLQNFFKGKFVIENVKPYYDYLVAPTVHIGRHPFWTNFDVSEAKFDDKRVHNNISGKSEVYGVSLEKFDNNIGDKKKMLRNMVNPEVGLYLLEMAINAVTGVKRKASKSYTPCLFDGVA